MVSRELIDIFSYRDHRCYLKELLQTAKKKGHRLKLRTIAEQAGFKSPSSISMVVNGTRNLTPSGAEKLANALSLSGQRKRYFIAMAGLETAKTLEERLCAQEEMLKYRGGTEEKLLESVQFRVLATWYYSAIFILAGSKHCDYDLPVLAKKLGKGITPEQVRAAVSDLVSVGLLSVTDGKLIRSSSRIKTPEDTRKIAVYRYHRQMIRLSEKAMELPLETREMNGVTVAIPKAQLATVKEKIRKFRQEIDEFLSPFEKEAEDVYQLNLHLFPLTKPEDLILKEESKT